MFYCAAKVLISISCFLSEMNLMKQNYKTERENNRVFLDEIVNIIHVMSFTIQSLYIGIQVTCLWNKQSN